MQDFQNMLKMFLESEQPQMPADNGGGAGGAVTLDTASSPTQAFQAFKQEQIGLWQKLQTEISQEISKLDNLQQHFGSVIKDLGTQKDVQTHMATNYTPVQRPDRSRLDAARAAWQNRPQTQQQPTQPGS